MVHSYQKVMDNGSFKLRDLGCDLAIYLSSRL